jgi:hypothetical protein
MEANERPRSHENPRSHMQTMSRREERRGTGWVVASAAVLAIVVGVGMVVWFFVPGFGASSGPKNAGVLSNQTVGSSVASQQTEPLRTTSPNSTDSYTVGRNQDIQHTEKPNLNAFSPAQLQAVQDYVAAHQQEAAQEVNFSIVVGAAVPTSAKLADLPPQLAQAMPNYKNDQFFVVNNQFVLVEGQTRRIVAIMPTANAKESSNEQH